MAEQHEKALVPQIRFAGFTDPWEQRKLGELCSFSKGCGYSKNDLRDQGTPIILYGRLYTNYETQIHSVDTFVKPLENSVYSEGGEVIIPASGETAEDISIASVVEKPGIILGGDLNVITSSADIDPVFLALELSYGKPHFDLAKRAQGKSVVHIHNEDIANVFFGHPNIAEQRRIGAFFDRLDSLITLHQRKYDKLCVLKKSMLDKMFPKGGSLYPEIRFAGFTDPWEQRKLGEVATFGGGHTPSMSDSDNYEGGNVLWVTSQDVKSHYLDGTTTQITEKGAKELTLYPAGSLVMVTRSGILRHTLPVAELRKPSTVNQDIRVILPQENYYGQWLLQFFISRNKELLLEFGKTGTTVESVDFSKMRDMVLLTPSLPEQQQIGRYFARLDNLITLHQRKYDKLCVLKKSMLDKMFPKGGSLYPEIRFAGFTDPWEQRKLGELFEESDERASDREILSVSVANGIYPASESDRETNPGASLANYKIVHFGDVVYNSMRMWQGAVDASRYDGIVSPAYVVTRPNSEVYARFFARLLRQPMLLKQYQQVSQGNSKDTQVLKFDDFASIGISMPASENEQRRIGAFFDRLDSLITLHQRKLELLRNIKKSMLDKMFV